MLTSKLENYKTIEKPLSSLGANNVYLANMTIDVKHAINDYKNNIEKRVDISDEIKKELLSQPILENYEITYYPIYFYETKTKVVWTSKGANVNTVYNDRGDAIFDIVEEKTYYNEKSGYSGVSKFYSRLKDDDSLSTLKINLNETKLLDTSKPNKIPLYSELSVYSEEEHKKNGGEAGRETTDAKEGQSTQTRYTVNAILVPIFKFKFEYNGKTFVYEKNLHNGAIRTDYKLKPLFGILKVALPITFGVLKYGGIFIAVLMTLINLLTFNFRGGFFNFLFGTIFGAGAMAIGMGLYGVFIKSVDAEEKSTHYYEKKLSTLDVYDLVGYFMWPVITFSVSLMLANIACSIVFYGTLISVFWTISVILVALIVLTWVALKLYFDLPRLPKISANMPNSVKILNVIYYVFAVFSWSLPLIMLLFSAIFGHFYKDTASIIGCVIALGIAIFLGYVQYSVNQCSIETEYKKNNNKINIKLIVKLFWKIALLFVAIFIIALWGCGVVFFPTN